MDYKSNLIRNLSFPLPGMEAQSKFAPKGRTDFTHSDEAKMASVMCLLYPIEDIDHIVLIERTKHDADKHSGQISFPGGQKENNDKNSIRTAVREMHEELNVEENEYEIIGTLSKLMIPISNFLVTPVIALAGQRPNFKMEEAEVQSIIEMPLKHLAEEANYKRTSIDVGSTILQDVPYIDFEGHVIWGATAMILGEFIQLIKL